MEVQSSKFYNQASWMHPTTKATINLDLVNLDLLLVL
jgi:hypothetical protein